MEFWERVFVESDLRDVIAIDPDTREVQVLLCGVPMVKADAALHLFELGLGERVYTHLSHGLYKEGDKWDGPWPLATTNLEAK